MTKERVEKLKNEYDAASAELRVLADVGRAADADSERALATARAASLAIWIAAEYADAAMKKYQAAVKELEAQNDKK